MAKTAFPVHKNELYPNSPLGEVVVEVRFDGEISVETKRDLFFDKIRGQYPTVWVPKAVQGGFPALQAYQFEKPDRKSGVGLALNRLSYYEREYRGHEVFVAEFMRLTGYLQSLYGIKKLNRIGWLYVNVIPIVRESGFLPIKRYFNFGMTLGSLVVNPFKQLNLEWHIPAESGDILCRLSNVLVQPSGEEALKLDIDSFHMFDQDRLPIDSLQDYVRDAHRRARACFESLVTEEYRDYLRGKVIG